MHSITAIERFAQPPEPLPCDIGPNFRVDLGFNLLANAIGDQIPLWTGKILLPGIKVGNVDPRTHEKHLRDQTRPRIHDDGAIEGWQI